MGKKKNMVQKTKKVPLKAKRKDREEKGKKSPKRKARRGTTSKSEGKKVSVTGSRLAERGNPTNYKSQVLRPQAGKDGLGRGKYPCLIQINRTKQIFSQKRCTGGEEGAKLKIGVNR